jgi:hypothetical protein
MYQGPYATINETGLARYVLLPYEDSLHALSLSAALPTRVALDEIDNNTKDTAAKT